MSDDLAAALRASVDAAKERREARASGAGLVEKATAIVQQKITDPGTDARLLPVWEWMLETLGQWRVIDLNHGPTHLQVQQQIGNAFAESLARTICGGDE